MLLNGKEVAEKIKAEQADRVHMLRLQNILPRLAIIKANDDAATVAYIGAKQKYGNEIGAEVEIYDIGAENIKPTVKKLNIDAHVPGIIIQLPLPETVNPDEVLNLVEPAKDVDGLGSKSQFQPAAVNAILLLLEHYGINLNTKVMTVIGQGRLVGAPLYKILSRSHKKVEALDEHTRDLAPKVKKADIVITATGQPGLVKSTWVKEGAVVIDAGTARVGTKLVGDASPELYNRADIKISPVPGGVGPLTVCALFANLLEATIKV